MSPKYGVNALGGMRYAVYKCRSAGSIHGEEARDEGREEAKGKERQPVNRRGALCSLIAGCRTVFAL